MPFPIDGRATGLEQMLADEEKIGRAMPFIAERSPLLIGFAI
jgi:hypothetical protein